MVPEVFLVFCLGRRGEDEGPCMRVVSVVVGVFAEPGPVYPPLLVPPPPFPLPPPDPLTAADGRDMSLGVSGTGEGEGRVGEETRLLRH